MKPILFVLLAFMLSISYCGLRTPQKTDRPSLNPLYNSSLEVSVLNFSKDMLKDSLRVDIHERKRTYYWDIQMIFEADDFKSDHFNTFTSYSDRQFFHKPVDENYEGILLFAATYKDVASAQHAFHELKIRTQIRMTDIEGQAGMRVEQVRIFERIRESGGLLTQKDNFVFYLLNSPELRPDDTGWDDYTNLFLSYITTKNEETEIIKADGNIDEFKIKKVKASR